MIIEREYRRDCINKRFPTLKGRKTIVYGTGINAKLIIDNVGEIIDIIGLMDDSQTGRELYGYRVLSREEAVKLGADTIIIAAKIDSAIAVYNRIKWFCDENDIEIYDLYGNNINDLLGSIIEFTDSSELDKLKGIIESADVLSIDLGALFDSDGDESEILREVWESKFHSGTHSFVELRKKIGVQQVKSHGDLGTIYGILKTYLCLSEENKNILLKKEYSLRKQHIIINSTLAEMLKAGCIDGKKIFLINESNYGGDFWESMLKINGFNKESVILLNRSELVHNKYNGLYREIFEYEPNKRYLHIGNDYYSDGVAASVYGIQSVVVKKALHQSTGVEDKNQENESTPVSRINEYCTDSVTYSFADSKYKGAVKLCAEDKYYVFVSEDAMINPGWLEQLVSTADINLDACVICSRVTGSDGTVFYAGQIIKETPEDQRAQMVSGFLPLYDYVRNTNLISTISFLIKKNDWDVIEDEEPSLIKALNRYWEQNVGKKIIYQPLSEVTYANEQIDLESFFVRMYENIKRPKILVTDNLLTRFDRDAGSRCTWFYLNQFHKIGFDVTFMAQNFEEIQPYVMIIQQAGIRVIYGEYYRLNWKSWLKSEEGSFKYVYTQRPDSTSFFLDEIKRNCVGAKIFYFAHDLHFLRLYRQYEITGDLDSLSASEKSKQQECAIIEAADVVHVVGSYEQEYLQRIYPQKIIRNIPLYIYDMNYRNNANFDVKSRKDLLYVGSFGHPPNLDAVVWFAEEIFPRIVERYPDIVWHVVGANPPVDVQKYQGKNLVLHGFLTDDELTKLYDTCRIVVVPLRYGAGVKGKILEASYHSVPIVTTPIGAEGIPQENNNMLVCETAEDFAKSVCELYSDEKKLSMMSDGGAKLIESYYSEKAVNEVLGMDMPEIDR